MYQNSYRPKPYAVFGSGDLSGLGNRVVKSTKKVWFCVKNRFSRVEENAIIVLGNQKSGTSAIAHLFADFGGLSKTIDIPPLWPPSVFKSLMNGEMDFSKFVSENKYYFSTEVIKEPSLTFISEKVIKRFPNARYLFIVRDPRKNIRSWLNRMNISGRLDEVVFRPDVSSLDRNLWTNDKSLNYVGVLAHKWNMAVDNYLALRDRMVLIKYEDFLAGKYLAIVSLAKRFGVQEKGDISNKLDIQYQPAGEHSTSLNDFFGMKNLTLIKNICGSRMTELGYQF
jgi:hypothetical protein